MGNKWKFELEVTSELEMTNESKVYLTDFMNDVFQQIIRDIEKRAKEQITKNDVQFYLKKHYRENMIVYSYL